MGSEQTKSNPVRPEPVEVQERGYNQPPVAKVERPTPSPSAPRPSPSVHPPQKQS